MRFKIGTVLIGKKAGPHTIVKLECENCGAVPEALGIEPRPDRGAISVRTACPTCNGTVQVFLKKGRNRP